MLSASPTQLSPSQVTTVRDLRLATQCQLFSQPDLKWDRLARAGQELVVLPDHPARLLVEPFVEHLAVASRRSMDAAMRRCSAGPSRETEVKSL
jgi:hypothetical protein